jgi:repressor of nif and glnA expression
MLEQEILSMLVVNTYISEDDFAARGLPVTKRTLSATLKHLEYTGDIKRGYAGFCITAKGLRRWDSTKSREQYAKAVGNVIDKRLGDYQGEELGKTCPREGAYNAYEIKSLLV